MIFDLALLHNIVCTANKFYTPKKLINHTGVKLYRGGGRKSKQLACIMWSKSFHKIYTPLDCQTLMFCIRHINCTETANASNII